MRVRTGACAVGLCWAFAGPVAAYHGGPRTVAVLGWDAKAERLYVEQVGHDESGGERNLLYYFDLRSSEPERPRVVEWSRQNADSAYTVRFQRLKNGLRQLPIVDEHAGSIVAGRVVAETTLASQGYSARKKVIEAGAWCWRGVPELRISTYHHAEVRCLRRYAIPDRAGRLLVLSYYGDPWEIEEVQRAVLLMRDPVERTQALDEPWGVR